MHNVLLYPNPNRDIKFELTFQTAEFLNAHGIIPILQDDVDVQMPPYVVRMPFKDGLELCDIIISLGGDGTILRISAAASEHGKPILGINAGKVGYLAELEKDELHYLDQIINGDYIIDKRSMIESTVIRGSEVLHRDRALNDAVITSRVSPRVITLDFHIDDHHISGITGDGLIVATPTGSSAYSMSAGGPLMDPKADGMLLTPICAHALFAKSFVVSGDSVCTIENTTHCRNALLTLDGIPAYELEPGDKVKVHKSAVPLYLMRLKSFNFYDILCRKLLK